MDKMEHIRGQVFQDQDVVLDLVDGFLNCHDHKGRKTFYGFFELRTDHSKLLAPGTCYRLVLADGRKCNIYTEIVPSNSAGMAVAEFHVTGGFKK
jgi:hypothetical protein